MVQVLAARSLLAAPDRHCAGGGVLVRSGRVERVLASRGAVRRAAAQARVEDLGDVTLAAGLIDAHAHLELGGLAGRLSGAGSFAGWILALLAARREQSPRELAAAVRAGARRLLATGTTAVGDVDSTGAAGRVLAHEALRARVYREVLDAGDPARTRAALAALARRAPSGPRLLSGISPHAPYTVSPALWRALGPAARRRRLWLALHWAETREELEWLAHAGGPFAALGLGTGGAYPARGGASGLAALEEAGLLGPRTALVHANHARAAELERAARAGACVVHCPGTQLFFGRGAPPLARFAAAGVCVALGTDSLASNADLDMRRELALLRRSAPWLAPRQAWAMATVHGAHALGLAGRAGELAPGAWADLCAFETGAQGAAAELEALTSGAAGVRAVWVAGRRVRMAGAPAPASRSGAPRRPRGGEAVLTP